MSSSTGTDSRWAARSTRARRALAAARRSSEPPWKIVRFAAVSHWSGVVAVSPITISMRSKATSSSSAASWASAVRLPVPRSTLPQYTVTRLSGLIVSQESTASLATDLGVRRAWAFWALAAPNMEKPTTSAPLVLRNSLRSKERFVVIRRPS